MSADNIGPCIVSAAAAADRKHVGVLVSQLVHLVHLFFTLLEASEVVLDEERGVELANSDLIVSSWRNDLVQQLGTRPLPHLSDHGAQFFICLVDVTCPGSRQVYKRHSNAHRHMLLIQYISE